MKLSVDRINKKSPYWVVQLSDMQFRFITKNGIRYRVGFLPDEYFLGDKAFHFFIDIITLKGVLIKLVNFHFVKEYVKREVK